MQVMNGHPIHDAGTDQHSIRIDSVLEEVLASASFSSSRQCQHLLRYLVEKSSQHADEPLKERAIGTEVFGRRPDYNTGDDPIVRARVGDVRKRLAQYYQSEEGRRAKVYLSIPAGGYRVVYRVRDDLSATEQGEGIARPNQTEKAVVAPSPSPAPAEITTQSERKTKYYKALAAGAILACLIVVFGLVRWHAGPQSALDQFWSPIWRNSKQVLVYGGTNAVYLAASDPTRRDEGSRYEIRLPPLAPGKTLTSNDVRVVNNEFTTVGDLLAAIHITSLLSTRRIGFDVRTGDDIAVGDLRHLPSILIGGSNNIWTLQMVKALPIAYIPGVGIQDKSGKRTLWNDNLNLNGGSSDGESYAIVVRMLNSEFDNPLIIVAGLTSWGTRVAGQFITDPVALKALASTLPNRWQDKNLEVVLRTQVIRGDAGSPAVVATRSW
jgi:hypothetical protein